jgi:hypothetical protein
LFENCGTIVVLQVLNSENEEYQMKAKKTVIAVLAVTLLISAALIVGCISPLEPGSAGQDEYSNFKIPAGKGVIRLKIADNNGARTIFPEDGDMTSKLSDMVFDIEFKPQGSGSTDKDLLKVDFDTFDDPVVLDQDTYDVNIIAYDKTDQSIIIAIWDSTKEEDYEDGIEVGTTTASVDVNLVGVTTGAKPGKLSYSITYGDLDEPDYTELAYTSQTVTVTNYTGYSSVLTGTDWEDPINIGAVDAPNTKAAADIPSGVYWVTIKLEADNCQDRIVSDVIYVYPTMTTDFTVATGKIDAPNQNKFTVKFDASAYDTTYGSDSDGIQVIEELTNAESPDPADVAYAGAVPTHPTGAYNFIGWFDDKDDEWSPGTNRVFKDRLITAKWESATPAGPGMGFNFTFTIGDPGVISADGDNATTYNEIKDDDGFLKFTVSGGITVTEWQFDGVPLGGGATLTIDEGSPILANLTVTGAHYLVVTGTKGVNVYSSTIKIYIDNSASK